jgi:predicted DNA-binding transcriptional regulator YafY
MSRSARLFEIIQIVRAAPNPVTAAQIAAMLEVSTRTVYRDIAALQAMRTPVEGAAGIGYVMRAGYDLPPLNFDIEEIEAITVGLSLLARTGDSALERAAIRVLAKIDAAGDSNRSLRVSDWGVEAGGPVDPAMIRSAIRDERKLRLLYRDRQGDGTDRVVWPIALTYFVEVLVVAAWCELRADFRHFRLDRIRAAEVMEEGFKGRGDGLRSAWDEVTGTDDLWGG